jgi:hypothetical protein
MLNSNLSGFDPKDSRSLVSRKLFYTADWSLPFGFNFEQVKRREFIALLGSLGVS